MNSEISISLLESFMSETDAKIDSVEKTIEQKKVEIRGLRKLLHNLRTERMELYKLKERAEI